MNLQCLKKWTGSGNLSPFRAQIQSDRFIMWYELRALALANHNNYVIHMQTLCHSVIRDHISLAGFSERGNNIFLCRGKALAVYSGFGSKRRRSSVRGDTCGRHAGSTGVRVGWEGCCLALLYVGPQRGGHKGLAPLLFIGLPQSAAPALATSTPTDPSLAVSQLWRYHRR